VELPLTKFLDPADFATLHERTAGQLPTDVLEGQHPQRDWEYRMALVAYQDWQRAFIGPLRTPLRILDVGGGGSAFSAAFPPPYFETTVVDPDQPPRSYATWIPLGIEEDDPRLPTQVEIIFALSVIEHVAHPKAFFTGVARRLVPGGLLFLTADAWDCDGPDVAHFHWMRQRIYNRQTWQRMLDHLSSVGLHRFGEADWIFRGNQVYDYSFISAALIKEGV